LKIPPETRAIVEVYKRGSKVGLSTNLEFINNVKYYLNRIQKDFRDPREIGIISYRLLGDLFSTEFLNKRISPDMK